jgi:hypothetical protein
VRQRVISVALLCVFMVRSMPVQAQDTPAATGKLNIVIVEGEGAINNVAREPIVQVEDENRRPVAGAAVTFLLPNQGAGASFANGSQSLTITTDAQGRAVARGLRPNNVNGEYQIRVNAVSEGRTATATISQSNAITAAAAAGGISAKVLAIIAIAGGAAAAGTVAATRGGNGNGGAGRPSPTIITPGAPTVGGPQ